MISIIIPHFNNQDTIIRAINSVLNQSYQNFEIVIIDDFSNDLKRLEKIINKINDKRITLITHTQNKNGSAARNTGIKSAKGEYIAFLDADDEWLENHLEKCIELIEKLSAPTLIYSKSIVKTTNYKDLVMPQTPIQNNQSISDYLFCEKGYMPTPSFFIKRELAQETMWNKKLKRHQDYDFLFRLEQNGVKFVMSEHTGVIVHWENNDTESKGGTWEYSLNYAQDHRQYFNSKTYSCFILKNVIYSLLKKREIKLATSILLKEVKITSLDIKEITFLINYYFFGNLKLLSKILKTYNL